VPNAREFRLKTSNEANFRAFFEFEALFVILNEDDSHEYYLDEQGRMFKLDNAAAFTVRQTTVLYFDGSPLGRFFVPDINAPLNAVGYNWYGLKAYLSMIQRFSEFDETVLYEAYSALEKQYPKALTQYYDKCIRIRKEPCRRFLHEIKDWR